MFVDGPLRLERVGRDQVEHAARSARGTARGSCAGPRGRSAGSARRGRRGAGGAWRGCRRARRPRRVAASSCRSGTVSTSSWPDRDDGLDGLEQVRAGRTWPFRLTRRISSASRRHGPAVIIRTSATSSCGSAMARRPAPGRGSRASRTAIRPPTTVYGMSSSRSRATIASRCLCLRYRTATSVHVRPVPLPSPASALIGIDDGDASSSGPAQTMSSTGSPPASRRSAGACPARSASRCCSMSRLAAVRTCPTERKFCSIRRRGGGPGGVAVGVVRGRPREAVVELGEGGEAGAAEAVDRLVVVADDHDVVRPVRRPPEQLDELDLGDVGVLELVDQEVAELALPAAQDVGPGLEQLRDGGDLLAEVERAAARELRPRRRGRRAASSVRRRTSRAAPSTT